MKHATFSLYSKEYDALKARHHCTLSNIFQDRQALEQLLATKDCLLFPTEGCLFLFVPFHGICHDCLYIAADIAALEDGLKSCLAHAELPAPVRVSVIGKEPLAGRQTQVFREQGFTLCKEHLRVRFKPPKPKIIEAMRALVGDGLSKEVSFAVAGEEEEILAMLLEEFDIIGDNLPDLPMIREDIAKRHIVVLRRDGRIAALDYSRRHRNTIHCLFDLTRKEYRREHMFTAISLFLFDASKEEKKNIQIFGWKDISRKRLINYAKHNDKEEFDGVHIYNLLYPLPAVSGEK